MFFIGFFGFQDRKKKIGQPRGACPCGHQGIDLVETERIFHFFFLPVFHWNRRYFLACTHCGAWVEITKERADRLMDGESVGPWDMPETHKAGYRFCPACGPRVQAGDVFCAKCGRKLEDE
jgi:hypothetical protein